MSLKRGSYDAAPRDVNEGPSVLYTLEFRVHGIDGSRIVCPVCTDVQIKNFEDMDNHLQNHRIRDLLETKPIMACLVCGAPFASTAQLDDHAVDHTVRQHKNARIAMDNIDREQSRKDGIKPKPSMTKTVETERKKEDDDDKKHGEPDSVDKRKSMIDKEIFGKAGEKVYRKIQGERPNTFVYAIDGKQFHREKSYKGTHILRCVKKNCKGRAYINGDSDMASFKEKTHRHTCTNNEYNAIEKEVKMKFVTSALKEKNQPLKTLLAEGLAEQPQEVRNLISERSIICWMKRARENDVPKVPTSADELLEKLENKENEEPFTFKSLHMASDSTIDSADNLALHSGQKRLSDENIPPKRKRSFATKTHDPFQDGSFEKNGEMNDLQSSS